MRYKFTDEDMGKTNALVHKLIDIVCDETELRPWLMHATAFGFFLSYLPISFKSINTNLTDIQEINKFYICSLEAIEMAKQNYTKLFLEFVENIGKPEEPE